MTTIDTAPRFEELDYRESNGIQVSLLWSHSDNSISVAVCDSRNGEAFEIQVAPDRALDAFHHPFAYASRSADPALQMIDESELLSR